MPKTPQKFEVLKSDRDGLLAAVASIVHAAGVTMELSLSTAAKIIATAEDFFDGASLEKLKSGADERCRTLRQTRREKRRASARRKAALPKKEPLTGAADAVNFLRDAHHDSQFAVWSVRLRARLEARIGAPSAEDAISLAAQGLPQSLTFAKAEKVEKF